MTKQIIQHTTGTKNEIVDIEYDVLEISLNGSGENSIGGLYLAERIPPKGKSKKSNKSKNAFALKKLAKFEKITDGEFLTLAASTDDARPILMHTHKNWAADGFRLHFTSIENKCKCKFCKNRIKGEGEMSPDYIQIIPKSFKGKIELERDAFLDAFNVCKIMAGYGSNVVKLLIQDNEIEFSSKSEEYGESLVTYNSQTTVNKNLTSKTYHYKKTGEDVRIGFNISFLIDAVKGMGEKITMEYSVPNAPAIFSDSKRNALIMPMHLG